MKDIIVNNTVDTKCSKNELGNKIEFVLISVCTYKRPQMLKNALDSVLQLALPSEVRVECLVVDNDKNECAKEVVEQFNQNDGIKFNYAVEPKQGLSSVRNKVLEEALKLGASHVFLFDDDEVLTQNSLLEHINLCNKYEDQIISSGIVLNRFAENTPKYIAKNIVFKERVTKKTGVVKNTCASGNVFFPVEMLKDKDLRFSSEYVFMGGEDGEFFKRASAKGYRIIQNTESVIYEMVSEARANLKYILKRAYYNGYSGSFLKFKQKGTKDYKRLLYVAKLVLVLFLNLLVLIPSSLFGATVFVNIISMICKTKGKIDGALSAAPLNFYMEVYGE